MLLGFSSQSNLNRIKEKVYEKAELQPEHFLELYEQLDTDESRLRIEVRNMAAEGAIIHSATGYKYDNIFLGADEDQVINFFLKDEEVADMLRATYRSIIESKKKQNQKKQ